MKNVRSFRFLDFCAGIGAGHAAAVKLGGECAGYAEINEKAKRTYRMLHNMDPLWEPHLDLGDLTRVPPSEVPDFDLMLGGFPCQTFSIVGRRAGFEDPRGQIIFALSDILKAKQPKYFLLENVKGLVSHDGGETLRQILILLDEAGYAVSYRVLASDDYGIPQIRERVYFVGVRKDLAGAGFAFQFPAPKKSGKRLRHILTATTERHEFGAEGIASLEHYLANKYNEKRVSVDDLRALPDFTVIDTRQSDLRIFEGVAPTLRSGRQGLLYVRGGKIRRISGPEALGLQGFGKEYQARVKSVKDSDLLYQAGNAFTVDVVLCVLTALFEQVAAAKLDGESAA